MKRFIHWLWCVLEVLIIIYVIAVTSLILCRNKYGYTQFGDYTFNEIDLVDERNIKDVKNGDLLIVKNSNDINIGDLIYYYAVLNDSYIIKSNVVIDIKKDDYSSLYTVDDGESYTVASTRVLGKYSNSYAHFGAVLNVLESKLGFLFLVLLPIMIVFIYQIYEFVVIIRYEKSESEKTEDEKNDELQKEKTEKVETKESVDSAVKEEETVIPEKDVFSDSSVATVVQSEVKTVSEEQNMIKDNDNKSKDIIDDDIEILQL